MSGAFRDKKFNSSPCVVTEYTFAGIQKVEWRQILPGDRLYEHNKCLDMPLSPKHDIRMPKNTLGSVHYSILFIMNIIVVSWKILKVTHTFLIKKLSLQIFYTLSLASHYAPYHAYWLRFHCQHLLNWALKWIISHFLIIISAYLIHHFADKHKLPKHFSIHISPHPPPK